jgi:hypothetical protein
MEQQQPGPAGCHEAVFRDALLENILNFVPNESRTSSCSIVCTSWQAPALSATVSAEGSEELEEWLEDDSAGLQALRVKGRSLSYITMPRLHQLTRLHLEAVTIHPFLLRDIGGKLEVGGGCSVGQVLSNAM